MNLTDPHEPTAECQVWHCYSHGVDEPYNGWLTCGECFHVYRTKGELKRRYRQQCRRYGNWRGVLRSYVIRASKIYFCQYCIHDF